MNSEIKTEYSEALVQDVLNALNGRSASANVDLSQQLYSWLYHHARKRAVDRSGQVHHVTDYDSFDLAAETDLGAKLEVAKREIDALVELITVRVVNGGQVDVVVPSTYEQTLNRLAFGSDWHDGHPDLAAFIVNTLIRSS